MSFFFASQALTLLAERYDEREAVSISSLLKDILESLPFPQNWSMIEPELLMVARALYYGCSLGVNATPGQDYCGLSVVSEQTVYSPVSKQRMRYVTLHRDRLVTIYALCTLLPYLRDRFSYFVRVCSAVNIDNWWPATFEHLHDAHRCAFYFDGRFHTLSRRMMSVRLISTEYPSHGQIQLKTVAWILLFKLGISTAAKVFVSMYRRMRSHQRARGGNASVFRRENRGQENSVQPLPSRQSVCALCRESATVDPATTVCGHIYCYKCITGWLAVNPICPICRKSQRPQQIRALYSY